MSINNPYLLSNYPIEVVNRIDGMETISKFVVTILFSILLIH